MSAGSTITPVAAVSFDAGGMGGSNVNARERFAATMNYGHPDRIPYWECAFWDEKQFDRWIEEGMPAGAKHDIGAHFGLDRSWGITMRGTVPVNIDLLADGRPRVIGETDKRRLILQPDGSIVERSIDPHNPTFRLVKGAVQNREDWLRIRRFLDPGQPERYPANWDEIVASLKERDYPICLNVGGYYGFTRNLMGMENLSIAFYDQPALIEEIFEYRTAFVLQVIERALNDLEIDVAEFWEDMAYKTGPLVSPQLYRRLALRHYRAITDVLRAHGVPVILVDSDGNLDELIPIWLDGGINTVWPLEVAAGNDPVAMRRKWGRQLRMIGGIDKRVLASTKLEIKQEVMSKVPPLVEDGGYIPTCDHQVPPDVPYDNYCYYRRLIREIAGERG